MKSPGTARRAWLAVGLAIVPGLARSSAAEEPVHELVAAAPGEDLTRVRAVELEVLGAIRKEGMTLVELAPAEREVLRKQTRPAFRTFLSGTSAIGRELLDAIERAQVAAGKRKR